MKIVELCGNPGCGKTTLCGSILSTLRDNGVNAFDYNEIKGKSFTNYLRCILPFSSIGTAVRLMNFGRESCINKRTFIYSFKCAIVLHQLKRWYRADKYDYILFDEGIIQYLTTLSHGKMIKNPGKLSFLSEFYQNTDVCVVNCLLNTNENIRRINSRGRETDRFKGNDYEKQKQSLILKRDNLDIVITQMHPMNMISVSTNSLENAEREVFMQLL